MRDGCGFVRLIALDLEISCGAKGKGGKTAAFRPPGFSILVESDAIIPVLVITQENCVEICAACFVDPSGDFLSVSHMI